MLTRLLSGVGADAEVQKEEQQPGEDAVKYGPMLTELDGLVMEGVSVEPSPSCELRKAVGYMSALGRLGRRLPAGKEEEDLPDWCTWVPRRKSIMSLDPP